MEGQVVKQVPGLDLCQEVNSGGTELKIRFVIGPSYHLRDLTMTNSYGSSAPIFKKYLLS